LDIHALLILKTDRCLRKVGTPETGDREDSQTFHFTPVGIIVERTFRKEGSDQLIIHVKTAASHLTAYDGWLSYKVDSGELSPDTLLSGERSAFRPLASPSMGSLGRSILIIRLLVGRVRTSKKTYARRAAK
jgi:hypothetical protein